MAALTGRPDLDAIIDCVGAEESIQMGFALLGQQGAYASVGLVGNRINIPLFPFVGREYTYFGSFWGNYNDLSEVMALAQAGKIRHSVKRVKFEEINQTMEALGRGEIVGRAVPASCTLPSDVSADRCSSTVKCRGGSFVVLTPDVNS